MARRRAPGSLERRGTSQPGAALGRTIKKEPAVAEYERAIQPLRANFTCISNWGRLCPPSRAVSLFEGAPVEVRSRPVILQSLAAALVEAGHYTEAAVLLEKTRVCFR